MLSLADRPYCHASDCLQGRDRRGDSEVLIVEGTERDDHVYNLGVWDGAGTGGAFLIDVQRLEPPASMRPDLRWHEHGMTLTLERPADVEFRFGLAETGSPNGW